MTPTQELVLDCYRSPHLLRSLADTAIPLPEGVDKVLRDATATGSTDARGDSNQLREATLLYVKRVMLLDEADHYRVLGLRFDATAEQIDAHYRLLVALLQMDKSMPTRELSRRVGRVSRAHAALSDPRRRNAYDTARFGALAGRDFHLPVESLVNSVLEDQVRGDPQVNPTRVPVTGELQPWAPPSTEGESERSNRAGPRPGFDAGETRVFRGPSNGALLAMSGAALLVIVAVSPVIVSRYSAYFMPPDTAAIEPAADRPQPATAQAVVDARGVTPAPLSFLTASPRQGVGAPLAVFAGGDEAVFRDGVDAQLGDDSMLAESAGEDITPELDRAADVTAAAEQVEVAALDRFEATPLTKSVDEVSPLERSTASRQTDASPGPDASHKDANTSAPEPIVAPAPVPTLAAVVTPTITQPDRAAQSESAAAAEPLAMTHDTNSASVSNTTIATDTAAGIAAVPVTLIDSYDLTKLVEQLAATYREGDADAFVKLFAENARTNDQPDRVGIAADYQELFRATERRSLQVDEVQWKQMEGGAVGEGRFVVRLKPKWKKREEVVSGKLTLEVKQQDQQLAITGLFHDYGAPARP